ncbi:MAG: 4Fe-4S dicluster domain-containing protein [Anaerolineae bacterium]|jgi:Fe-S oxidoreductase/nitrate reductase gamma subunit|nr:4Fe-4S dicluster domain-containing protein [Chloroflexota bacterium]MBV6436661.1 putative iron-sulfur-binding oxidoreductase FadF [Anaerolineae bacterium]MDL1915922.1 4Fe-4S dicluster domain-containing protein [Anaerolineae bacterium CFX4]OQY85214.1 MAG: [Fe-S]-binding protein [Anaerolineae bacterium UTCFX5]MCO6443727.1 4Fe-4S dicluster domain-containing protein [Anaerolineae bacterium]
MLTPFEQMLFILLALLAVGATYTGFLEMWQVINRGEGSLSLNHLIRRASNALWIYLSQRTTLKTRRITSMMHAAVVWGFTFYFLVNAIDALWGFIPGFEEWLVSTGLLYDGFRLLADVLSVAVLIGVAYLIVRRFVLPNRKDLTFHDNVLLHPKIRAGAITRDSMIVAGFILLHVGARFLGEAVTVHQHGAFDPFMPFASVVSVIFSGLEGDGLTLMRHLMWWIALGGILVFMPYFPYTKHAHLFMAPLNFLTKPERTSLGEMRKLDLEDEDAEQFGVKTLTDLPMAAIFDAYACIQCNRCQDVCPAYLTGKELSPSALEINKRYLIKDDQTALAAGGPAPTLLNFALSESAVWACTACGACVDICPVGNEPMHDILGIRQDRVLMESEFPSELTTAFQGMERRGNPWGSTESRLAWAKGLEFPVPTVDENPDFDILYWTGCAVAYDPRAQLTARALVKVLNKAGVNFAVLGDAETCTGDVARRAGNEALYQEMATANVETLNEVKPPRIVVTCPHCFHNIGREYHQFGGSYEIVHHTELLDELIASGKLPASAKNATKGPNVTFHDPCYLGRHNGIVDAPRDVLSAVGIKQREMPRHGTDSFCCGAGGAQFWKEEEHGTAAVNVTRYKEAQATGAEIVAVGCPFCAQMFESAKSEVPDGPVVKDVVELVAERL